MKNFENCKYTYLHRKSFNYYVSENKYLSEEDRAALLERGKYHDLDKVSLYLFWDKKDASNHHRATASHHLGNDIPKEKIDYLEAIFDFECAALTKPDKPYNAYDTGNMGFPDHMDILLPLLKELHMDSSYCAITKEGLEYMSQFDVDEFDIKREVGIYLRNGSNNTDIKKIVKICSLDEYNKLTSGVYLDKIDKNSYQVIGNIRGMVNNQNKWSTGKNFESWKYNLSYFDKDNMLVNVSGGGDAYMHIEDVMDKLNKIYATEIKKDTPSKDVILDKSNEQEIELD